LNSVKVAANTTPRPPATPTTAHGGITEAAKPPRRIARP
jgi:hypothetical protein